MRQHFSFLSICEYSFFSRHFLLFWFWLVVPLFQPANHQSTSPLVSHPCVDCLFWCAFGKSAQNTHTHRRKMAFHSIAPAFCASARVLLRRYDDTKNWNGLIAPWEDTVFRRLCSEMVWNYLTGMLNGQKCATRGIPMAVFYCSGCWCLSVWLVCERWWFISICLLALFAGIFDPVRKRWMEREKRDMRIIKLWCFSSCLNCSMVM